jgi:hypothetical protein
LSDDLHLVIIHEPSSHAFEGIADFATEHLRHRPTELDVLFVSDEASWRGSRRRARELKGLQTRLDKSSPNSLVRRV